MKLGIISDSHDHHRNVLKAIDMLKQHQVETILHAGDIIAPFTAEAFLEAEIAPMIAVFGNNDGEKLVLRQLFNDYHCEIHDGCYQGTIAGKNIFMTHMHTFIDDVAKSQDHDLVIYGHTHQSDIRFLENTLVINPGEITDWRTGQGHIVILDTDTMEYTLLLI